MNMDKALKVSALRTKIDNMEQVSEFLRNANSPTLQFHSRQSYGKQIVTGVKIEKDENEEFFSAIGELADRLIKEYSEEITMIESTYTLGELVATSPTITGLQYVLYIMEPASGKGVSDRTDIVAKHAIGPTSASGINQWILGMLPSQGGNGDWSNARVIYHTIDEGKIMRIVVESLPKD